MGRVPPLVAFCVVLLVTAPHAGPARSDALHPPVLRPALAESSSPSLTVAPASWWMVDGTNVTLSANWTNLPPGCSISPDWFRWSIGGGSAQGSLAPANGSTTSFAAVALDSGSTTVVVRSAASTTCGGVRTAVVGNATANVTVDAPLSVRTLSMAPNPAPPGTEVVLTGTISGGLAPYLVRVAWGDGDIGWANESHAGSFALPHDFAVGVFSPSVSVEDSAGFAADDTVDEPLNVSSGFAVAIAPSSGSAEVGAPVAFSFDSVNSPAAVSSIASCAGATIVGVAPTSNSTIDCAFAEPGIGYVSYEAVGAVAPYAVASAFLPEPVAPRLGVSVAPPTAVVQQGTLGFVPVAIAGGVAPFNVTWRLVGNRSNDSATVAGDGTFFAAVGAATPGADLFSVDVIDALGVETANVSETVDVRAALAASDAVAVTVGPAAETVNLSGSVLGGSPPFDWAVVPDFLVTNETALSGMLAGIGAFGWDASGRAEGSDPLEVVVVDAAGAVWTHVESVALRPSPTVSFVASAPSSGGFDAQILVAGGAPPFDYWLNDTTGGSWSGSLPIDGVVAIRGTPTLAGNATFELTVRDAWGVSGNFSESFVVAPTPAEGPDSGALVGEFGLVVLAALSIGGGAWWWRHRSAGRATDVPDARATLYRILSPADGADRAVVELVAEEDGIPLNVVRETLDRLIAEGTVRAERGMDGEEVLAWSPDVPP